MKRTIIALAALTLAFAFTGCANNSTPSADSAAETEIAASEENTTAAEGTQAAAAFDETVMTPAAKPVSARCTPRRSSRFMKNTHAAPSDVPKNGIRSPATTCIFIWIPPVQTHAPIPATIRPVNGHTSSGHIRPCSGTASFFQPFQFQSG